MPRSASDEPGKSVGGDSCRFGRARLADFSLDPNIVHLNHGSYGAVPKVLAEEQLRWRARIEANPTWFFRQELPGLLREAADAPASAFGGSADDWVFIENATQAANAVIPALELKEGDHVLATSELYNAVRQALTHHAGARGAVVEEICLPLPINSNDVILEAFEQAFRPETKAVFLDHVTSRSAIIMPVKDIARMAKAHGSAIFIDGAHAPGMLDLDVTDLGADWYTGNAHKWLNGPRGCALLWTSPEWQERTHPVTISHGYGAGYTAEFDWVGTRDVTPWLCFPRVLEWHRENGGAELRVYCSSLARQMGERLAAELGTVLATTPELMGSMACVRLPGVASTNVPGQLEQIAREASTAVSLNLIGTSNWLRVSAAIYNGPHDLDRLIEWINSR